MKASSRTSSKAKPGGLRPDQATASTWPARPPEAHPSVLGALQSTEPPAGSHPDSARISLAHLAALSRTSEPEIRELMGYGLLAPAAPGAEPWSFNAACIPVLQRANHLRDDLALDGHAFALAVMLLTQINGLEAEVDALRSGHVISNPGTAA